MRRGTAPAGTRGVHALMSDIVCTDGASRLRRPELRQMIAQSAPMPNPYVPILMLTAFQKKASPRRATPAITESWPAGSRASRSTAILNVVAQSSGLPQDETTSFRRARGQPTCLCGADARKGGPEDTIRRPPCWIRPRSPLRARARQWRESKNDKRGSAPFETTRSSPPPHECASRRVDCFVERVRRGSVARAEQAWQTVRRVRA